jgi:hypothetical protein
VPRERTLFETAGDESGSPLQLGLRQPGQFGSRLDSMDSETAVGKRFCRQSRSGSDLDHHVTLVEVCLVTQCGKEFGRVVRTVTVVLFCLSGEACRSSRRLLARFRHGASLAGTSPVGHPRSDPLPAIEDVPARSACGVDQGGNTTTALGRRLYSSIAAEVSSCTTEMPLASSSSNVFRHVCRRSSRPLLSTTTSGSPRAVPRHRPAGCPVRVGPRLVPVPLPAAAWP